MISFTRDELLNIWQDTPQNLLLDFDDSDVLLDIVVGGAAVLFRCFSTGETSRLAQWSSDSADLERHCRASIWRISAFYPTKRMKFFCSPWQIKMFSNSAALCFTEAWLNDAIPDSALHLPNFQLFRADRDAELFWKAKEQILFQWFCFSAERSERDHQLQDTIPQHCGEWTTDRQSEWVPLQVWKNTIHISCNPLLPPPAMQISEDDVCQVFRKNKRRKAPGPDGVTPACLKTWADQLAPIFTQIFNRSLELCRSPLMLQTLHRVPKKPQIIGLNNYRPAALTSVAMTSFERLVLAYLKDSPGPPAVCLQSKPVCGWYSQHGTALHPATSGQTRDLCEDPVGRLQLRF